MCNRISRTVALANIACVTIDAIHENKEEEDADHKDPTQKPSINLKDWNKMMDLIEEMLSRNQGTTKNRLNCTAHPETTPPPQADDDKDNCDLLDDKFVARAPTV